MKLLIAITSDAATTLLGGSLPNRCTIGRYDISARDVALFIERAEAVGFLFDSGDWSILDAVLRIAEVDMEAPRESSPMDLGTGDEYLVVTVSGLPDGGPGRSGRYGDEALKGTGIVAWRHSIVIPVGAGG